MAEYIEGQGLNSEDYGYEKGKFISVEETEKEIEQVKEAIIDSTKQELQDLVKNDEKAIEMLFDALELVGIVEEEYSTYQKAIIMTKRSKTLKQTLQEYIEKHQHYLIWMKLMRLILWINSLEEYMIRLC